MLLARRAIEAADIVLLVVDATAGATDQDAAIAGEADRAGRGVVIVDHDIELLSRLCDRLICLDRGAVIASGPPDLVRADPGVRAGFLGGEAVPS